MKRIASALATLVLGMSLAHAASTEQAFVTQAAQGGLAEVELGQLALARGASRAVKAFAQTMVEDHRKANADLEKVAAAAGASVPTEPSTAHKAVADRLGSLSGNEFDVAYSTQMVADHEKTIALFEQEAASGANPDLKAFAASALPTLRAHLEHAKELPGGDGRAPARE